MEYAVPYVLLICLYGILALWYHLTGDATKRAIILLLCSTIFLFFFGFRGFCFYDWNAYYPAFQSIPTNLGTVLFNETWYEPGFTTLIVVCKSIYNNYHFFIFVCTCINTILLTRFLFHYIDNIPLGFIIYLCMGGITISTDLLRNAISIMLFINAIEYIIERRPVYYFGVCILALSFHLSSIFFFQLYFILNRNWGYWTYLALFCVGNAILLFQIPVFKSIISFISIFLDETTREHIDEYTRLLPSASFQISIGYLERLLTGLLVFLYYNRLQEVRGSTIFINCLLIYFTMFFVFSEFKTISLRLSTLFAFAYIPIWTDLIKCISIKFNRMLFIAFICVYSLFKILNSTNGIIYDYDNVLWGADSFNVRQVIFKKNYDGD